MIQTDDIILLLIPGEPFHPEIIVILFHLLPVIDWISPALSVVTEIIRRYSCDMTWISLRIQQEILLILPDIRTVQSDIKRKIAHDFHTMCVRICFYLIPLLIEDELQKLFITDFLFKLLQRKAAVANPFTLLLWPLCPACHLIMLFQRYENSVWIQPWSSGTKQLVFLSKGILHLQKGLVCLFQIRCLESTNPVIIHLF